MSRDDPDRLFAAAHFWKGKTLLSMGKRDAAAKEFREVVNKYPSSDVVQASLV
jgi:TolA-binding protein